MRKTPAGVTESQYRRALDSLKTPTSHEGSALNSSALQSDLAKKYNLPGAAKVRSLLVVSRGRRAASNSAPSSRTSASNSNNSGSSSSGGGSSSNASSNPPPFVPLYCAACDSLNDASSNICTACGYFLYSARQQSTTLAQRMGLTEAPIQTQVVTISEWEEIERKVAERDEAYCPICMIGFNQGSEIVLSCSHVFHRACIASFEKFMENKERCCPICRESNYQKKMTDKGSKAFQVVCARLIQSNYRGFAVRKKYQITLRAYYKTGGGVASQRKKFYQQELVSYANRVTEEVDKRSCEVNTMFNDMDAVILENRQLDAMFDLLMAERQERAWMSGLSNEEEGGAAAVSATVRGAHSRAVGGGSYCQPIGQQQPLLGEFWTDILKCAKERGWHECAICMGPNNNMRQTVLLSCTHVFHSQCIENFEKYTNEENRACPVCRRSYDKFLLSENDLK